MSYKDCNMVQCITLYSSAVSSDCILLLIDTSLFWGATSVSMPGICSVSTLSSSIPISTNLLCSYILVGGHQGSFLVSLALGWVVTTISLTYTLWMFICTLLIEFSSFPVLGMAILITDLVPYTSGMSI
jgi:hypothetical protein